MVTTTRKPLIAFEGCDGAGKTTTRLALRAHLLERGIPCMAVGMHSWLVPEVARTIVNIREQRVQYPPEELHEAYFRDRSLHVLETIVPALSDLWVIADRYYYSDAIYQEVLYGIPAQQTLARYRAAGVPAPDIVVHLDLDSTTAYERIVRRGRKMRHYERVPELSEVVAAYHRVFYEEASEHTPTVIRFVNDSRDQAEKIENVLLPRVLAAAADSGSLEYASS